MREMTGNAKVLLSKWGRLNKDGMPENVSSPTFIQESQLDSFLKDGYTLIGDAQITVNIITPNEIVKNKVSALREEAKSVRAEATVKENRIQQQIQDLLAIGFNGNPSFEDDLPF